MPFWKRKPAPCLNDGADLMGASFCAQRIAHFSFASVCCCCSKHIVPSLNMQNKDV